MKVLLLSAYYDPEVAASLYLSTNLNEDLANSGFDVEIFTPMPTRGVSDEIREKYKHKYTEVLCEGRLTIHRMRMPKETKGTITRAIRYILLNILLFFKALGTQADVIFLYSTPPTQGLMGAWLKKIKKVPVIYDLQDIFPDSLINTGLTSNSIILKIGKIMERYIYKNVSRIIVISEDFKKNLLSKGVPENKIDIVYNWVDENAVRPIERKDNVLISRYSLNQDNFYITYSGNIGHTQNMDMLVDIAKELVDYKSISIVIIGDGSYKSDLVRLIKENNITNIIMLPFQPYEDISHVFSLGDAGLIISKANIGQNSVPSKTWSIMSAERPVVASFDIDSELCNTINRAHCGVCVPADNKEALKTAILELYNNRVRLKEIGKNGRQYILDNLTREKGTSRIREIIIDTINTNQ
ncbi:glycosyltransferase family 4 protein [Clostridium sp.]